MWVILRFVGGDTDDSEVTGGFLEGRTQIAW